MLIQPPIATTTNPAPGPTPNSGPTDTAIPRRPRLNKRLRRAIDDAALPEPLARLIITVALGSRLRPGEQADVAKELAAHFRAGLDTGHSPQDLTSAFGDPRLAARLIRRAKRRARGPLWRAWRWFTRALAASAGAAFVVFGFLLARYYLGAPNVSVDYLAKLNAPIEATPPDQRAYSLYLQALASLPDPTQDSLAALANDLRARGVDIAPVYIDPREFIDAKPDDPAWPLAVAYADSLRPVIETLHAAAARTTLGEPYTLGFHKPFIEAKLAAGEAIQEMQESNDSEYGLLSETIYTLKFPILKDLIAFARLLALDARVSADRGDFAQAALSIRGIAGLAGITGQRVFMLEQIAGYAFLQHAYITLADVFSARMNAIPDDEIRQLSHSFALAARVPLGQRVIPDHTGEKYGILDMIQRTYTDNGDGDGHMSLTSLRGLAEVLKPLFTDFNQSMQSIDLMLGSRSAAVRYVELLFKNLEEVSGYPMPRDLNPARQTVERLSNRPLPFILSITMPSFRRSIEDGMTTGATRDAALIALATEAYRRQHGSMPQRLEDLIPDFLPFAPLDPWIDAPLRIAFTDDSVTVYSVGSDLDDDTGRPAFQTVRETVVGGIYAWQVKPPPQSESLPVRTVEIQDRAAKPRLSNQPSQRIDADWVIWPQPRRIIDSPPPSPAPLPPG